VALYLADRVLNLRPAAAWRSASVPIIGTVIMVAAVIGVQTLCLVTIHTGDLPALAACIVTAIIVYPLVLVVLDRNIIAEARTVLARGL
jgi:hypothetical protein